ncbi:ABC transporter permease [Mobilitalea sibirica]|uniref:ABC transporter permease n=1 Tax=Mobilitalea sibirica TaxID=1462919 RepID=A0A8J7HC14_9FIRM|nr:ABC transporter permease [Mobilitalea sibirica]MBH1942331.1 ABC transporter permease [Mobilitalea sibirica]
MMVSKKALLNSFKQFMVQIYKDAMLILLCIAPLLAGSVFKFGIPFAQELIYEYFGLTKLFVPYYLLFDLLLGSLTPLLYCFAAAYVVLGEIDDGISGYLSVTPLGKRGYLISRLGFPAVISFVVSIVLMMVFSLSDFALPYIVGIALSSNLLGIIEALLVVSLSSNRVEGMAVSKLTGLFFLGLPVPFFVEGSIQYLVFFLPSFWLAKFAIEKELLFLLTGVLVSLVWIFMLNKKFNRKINK